MSRGVRYPQHWRCTPSSTETPPWSQWFRKAVFRRLSILQDAASQNAAAQDVTRRLAAHPYWGPRILRARFFSLRGSRFLFFLASFGIFTFGGRASGCTIPLFAAIVPSVEPIASAAV